jgi:lysozyme
MRKRTGILGAIVLTIVLTAFTSSALAGNGQGNGAGQGNGNGNSQPTPATEPASPAPGNSANAPGKDKGSSSATTSSTTTSGGGKSGQGHAKKSGSASASTKGSASQNAGSQAGMKPTNATTHHTFCKTGGGGSSVSCTPTAGNTAGAASGKSDVSKRYGNGKTAAQIAASRGAPADTMIYGPGNSQPHKVQKCPGSGHWVDVHAVKSYSAASCSSSTKSSESASSSSTTFQTVVGQQAATTTQTAKASQSASAAAAVSARPTGGVLGAQATVKSAKPAGGVAGAIAAVGNVAGETLPFTGFPIWIAMLVAVGLIALGAALLRRSRATT